MATWIVVANAALGIVLVLFGRFGETEARILGTSSVVAVVAFGLLVLAPLRPHRWSRGAALVGRPTLMVTGVGLLALIWIEGWGDTALRSLANVATVAVASIVLAGLGAIPLERGRDALYRGTFCVGVLVAAGIVFMTWWDEPSEVAARLLGASAVLFAGLFLVLLISGGRARRTVERGQPGLSSLVRQLHRIYRRDGLTLSIAESMTSGAVLAAVGSVSGASDVLRGGVVTYALDSKVQLLGLDASEIEGIDAVSADTALRMAEAVRERFGADVGLAVTGWSEPWADHLVEYPKAAVAVVGPGLARHSQWVLGAGDGRVAMIGRTVAEAVRLAVAVAQPVA